MKPGTAGAIAVLCLAGCSRIQTTGVDKEKNTVTTCGSNYPTDEALRKEAAKTCANAEQLSCKYTDDPTLRGRCCTFGCGWVVRP
jgi:hypothetical protein